VTFSETTVAFFFLLSHDYDDLLLSAATTVATPSGEFSVQRRQQLLPKRH